MRVRRMKFYRKKLVTLSVCLVLAAICLYVVTFSFLTPLFWYEHTTPMAPLAIVMAPHERYIVPNIVHFLRFGPDPLTFLDAVCILAALKHQRPEKLFVHTDQYKFNGGKYWDVVMADPSSGVVQVKYLPRPQFVFGQKLANILHSAFVARLLILMRHGGIYLDNDCYVVKSLNEFRRFDITLGWQEEKLWIGNQIIIANGSAKLLQKWYEGYRYYNSDDHFNSVIFPTNILKTRPDLAHIVAKGLGEYRFDLFTHQRYYWRLQYAIHLSEDHPSKEPSASNPKTIDETNILSLKASIIDMVLKVYPIKVHDDLTNSKPMEPTISTIAAIRNGTYPVQ